jgi:carboxypeptidase C (cathepsin A)
MKLYLSLLLLLSLPLIQADESDIMFSLPDCNSFFYNSYSGYLKVTDKKSLHYVFIESQDDPLTDPLMIWFNGGPGCSSLGGFFQEHGPWVIDDNQTYIHENPYSWNVRANMLYIEMPAGVGYSIGDPDNMNYNDMSSSQDNLIALIAWYAKFPEFVNHDLYISGESYAGIYVPYLAW